MDICPLLNYDPLFFNHLALGADQGQKTICPYL
jgi:hypothetical protein